MIKRNGLDKRYQGGKKGFQAHRTYTYDRCKIYLLFLSSITYITCMLTPSACSSLQGMRDVEPLFSCLHENKLFRVFLGGKVCSGLRERIFFLLATEQGPEGVSCWVSDLYSSRTSPTGHRRWKKATQLLCSGNKIILFSLSLSISPACLILLTRWGVTDLNYRCHYGMEWKGKKKEGVRTDDLWVAKVYYHQNQTTFAALQRCLTGTDDAHRQTKTRLYFIFIHPHIPTSIHPFTIQKEARIERSNQRKDTEEQRDQLSDEQTNN